MHASRLLPVYVCSPHDRKSKSSMLTAALLVFLARPACSQVSCNAGFSCNALAAVRRSGTAENGWMPSDPFASAWPGFDSDSALEHVSIIRSTPIDPSYSSFWYGVSNASAYQGLKKAFAEVGDVLSFDVVIENYSSGFGFVLAAAEVTAGATLALKLGCQDAEVRAQNR